MTEYRKVKDMNKGWKNKPQETEKQLEARRESGLKTMLTKNPMYNPESIEKYKKNFPKGLEKRKNNLNYKRTLFKLGNKFGTLKKKEMSEERKTLQSLRMSGRKGNPKNTERIIRMFIFNHPMKNPESAKRNAEARSLKLPKEVLEKTIQEFNSGKSITQIAKEIKVDRIALGKLLRKNGIIINAEERNRLDHPLKKRTQFKAGQKPVCGFKKDYIPWNKKIQEEVKNEEDNSIAVAIFNPAVIAN